MRKQKHRSGGSNWHICKNRADRCFWGSTRDSRSAGQHNNHSICSSKSWECIKRSNWEIQWVTAKRNCCTKLWQFRNTACTDRGRCSLWRILFRSSETDGYITEWRSVSSRRNTSQCSKQPGCSYHIQRKRYSSNRSWEPERCKEHRTCRRKRSSW